MPKKKVTEAQAMNIKLK